MGQVYAVRLAKREKRDLKHDPSGLLPILCRELGVETARTLNEEPGILLGFPVGQIIGYARRGDEMIFRIGQDEVWLDSQIQFYCESGTELFSSVQGEHPADMVVNRQQLAGILLRVHTLQVTINEPA